MHPQLLQIDWPFDQPIIRTDSKILHHDMFRIHLEQETRRHKRYLSGFGLVRIGPGEGHYGSLALGEALETETRQTDTVCGLDDGSFVVLVLEANESGLLAVARRIESVAHDIGKEAGCDIPVCAGIASTGARRVSADEMWMAATTAWELARSGDENVISACG